MGTEANLQLRVILKCNMIRHHITIGSFDPLKIEMRSECYKRNLQCHTRVNNVLTRTLRSSRNIFYSTSSIATVRPCLSFILLVIFHFNGISFAFQGCATKSSILSALASSSSLRTNTKKHQRFHLLDCAGKINRSKMSRGTTSAAAISDASNRTSDLAVVGCGVLGTSLCCQLMMRTSLQHGGNENEHGIKSSELNPVDLLVNCVMQKKET